MIVTFRLGTTLSDFDREAFNIDLAALLDIDPERVRLLSLLSVESGEDEEVTIVCAQAYQDRPASWRAQLALMASSGSLSRLLGVRVLSHPEIVTSLFPPPWAPPPNPPPAPTQIRGGGDGPSDATASMPTDSGSTADEAGVTAGMLSIGTVTGIAVAGVCLLVLSGLTALLALYARDHTARANALINDVLAANDHFLLPLHFIKAHDFLSFGRLVVFEEMRALRKHEIIDHVTEARLFFSSTALPNNRLVFISHQVRRSPRARARREARAYTHTRSPLLAHILALASLERSRREAREHTHTHATFCSRVSWRWHHLSARARAAVLSASSARYAG
jgi:hypothetical protein